MRGKQLRLAMSVGEIFLLKLFRDNDECASSLQMNTLARVLELLSSVEQDFSDHRFVFDLIGLAANGSVEQRSFPYRHFLLGAKYPAKENLFGVYNRLKGE